MSYKNVKDGEKYIILCQFDKHDDKGFLTHETASIKKFGMDICGTICSRYYKGISSHEDNMIMEIEKYDRVKQLGNLSISKRRNPNCNRVYDKDYIAPTISTMQGGNRQPMVINQDKQIVAMRGRNPDNPSDRRAGIELEQRLEPNTQGMCNALTSVQKDNMLLEQKALTPKRNEYGKTIRKQYESHEVEEHRYNMVDLEPRQDDMSNTITTVQKDNMILNKEGEDIIVSEENQETKYKYRIRKLTPIECWRLMDFHDRDFLATKLGDSEKADKVLEESPKLGKETFETIEKESVMSNTQLYKQAGNAIVRNVLCALFSQLNIRGIKPWNEMTIEERNGMTAN